MNRQAGQRSSWRDNLDDEACAAIESAGEQLAADEEYEAPEGPKLRSTLQLLGKLEQQANDLTATIDDLSPVGKAAMYEAGEERRIRQRKGEREIYTGRHKLWELKRDLKEIAISAEMGATILSQMHSPCPDSGQGTGSAMGRDSDLRAIRVDQDQPAQLPTPFRSPKDKFAVRVIMGLISGGLDPGARGASKLLEHYLNDIWAEFREGSPPNWARPIKARHAIAEWVATRRKSREVWKRAISRGNATSLENGKMPT